MESRSLVCADCGTRFEFSAEEEQRFAARGFSPPKRCRDCRAAKRRRQAATPPRGGEPRPRPEPRAPRDGPPREMHAAACTVCGAATEVPFVPDGKRPVYCVPCLKERTR